MPAKAFDINEFFESSLVKFLVGKKIVGIRFRTLKGFNLILEDGSELEIYSLSMDVECRHQHIPFWTEAQPGEVGDAEGERRP